VFTDAELWKKKFAEAQEIVRTKCSLYTQDQSSDDDDESSITRSEDTDTPEPKSMDKSDKVEDAESDGVVLKLKELKVESEKPN
jgi:cytoskeletal protein RodZ